MPWTPDGYEGQPPTACPGYTCKLPEVTEAIRAHTHWEKGELSSFTQGEQATEILVDSIEVVHSARTAVERWLSKQKD